MRSDALIEVTCDGCKTAAVELEILVEKKGYSAGQYNTTRSALDELLEYEGWGISPDGEDMCENCYIADDSWVGDAIHDMKRDDALTEAK